MKQKYLSMVIIILLYFTVTVYSQENQSTTAIDTTTMLAPASSENQRAISQDTITPETNGGNHNGNGVASLQTKVSMRFDKASLDQVLRFISRVTGFTIVKDGDVTGDITILSEKDITVEDALNVLNSALANKGYTAIRTGNILKIVSIGNAKQDQVRVEIGTDPNKIKATDEVITQVMPLQYADAAELKKDLANLLPKDRSDLSANARSNTLIITDVASNVKRIAEIIKELDAPQASVTQIRVFTLRNADATTLAKTLNDIFKQDTQTAQTGGGGGNPFFRQFVNQRGGARGGGTGNEENPEEAFSRTRAQVKITTDDRTNSIIVSAPGADMVVITDLVDQLDKDATEQEGTLVIHLQHGDAASLSTMFTNLLQAGTTPTTPTGGGGGRGGFIQNLVRATQSAAQAQGSSLLGQVKIAADTKTNSLVFITSPRNFPRLREMVAEVDYARPQVFVEVILAERTLNDETQLGAEWSFSTVGSLFGNLVTTVSSTGFSLGTNLTQGLTYMMSHQSIQATIQALKTNTKLNVLSTPRILTSDNAAATIKVGQHVPFLTSRQVTDTGSVFNSFQYQDVGITLTVTPHVNPDGYVSMDVHPIVSQLESATFFDAPVVDNREAQTSVMVKDGETVIIGGLMQTTISENDSKVPLLGDIPLVGWLFSSKDHAKVKTELMVFLTPHVVHNAEELHDLSAPDKAKLDESTKQYQKKGGLLEMVK